MDDWKKRLLELLAKYPDAGIHPDRIASYPDGTLWGIYLKLRDRDDAS